MLQGRSSFAEAYPAKAMVCCNSDEDAGQMNDDDDRPFEAVLALQVVVTIKAVPLTVDATGAMARALDLCV
jgi:hypothetical protein